MGAKERNRAAAAERRTSPHPHARTRLRSSVRVRLLVPVLLATVAVAALGSVPVVSALNQAARADRSTTLAKAAGTVGAVAHEIAAEFVASNAAHRVGSRSTLDTQLGRTNGALLAFEAATPSIRAAEPGLARLVDAAQDALDGLGSARAVADRSPDGSVEVSAYYNNMLTSLLAVADALPPQMQEPALIELARALALAVGLDRLAALQLDLVARGLAHPGPAARDQIALAQWMGGERTQIEELTNLPAGRVSYGPVGRSAASVSAARLRQAFLDVQTGDAALGVAPDEWAAAQGGRIDDLWAMEQQLAQRLVTETTTVATAARERAVLFAIASIAIGVAILGTAITMMVTIGQRLRRTRYAALSAARVELPAAISQVTSARDAAMVRTALANSSARVDSMLQSGQDELGELAAAFGAVHRQALRLAADQALLRMEVQAMFIALSRRGQTLVQRQIYLIDQFGRDETDPDALSRLFALDHLAARMRRNEENLLVLAGGEPGRWITRPVAIVDLIRAAAQEIEDYRRVDVLEAPEQAISAHVAGDVIHLLAELVENATAYSPPESRVWVSARRTTDGVVVTVHDEGIGMPADRLAEANDRLARPSALTSTLVGTMGLLVVARLAQRHSIEVRLDSIAASGTTATVILPDRLVLPLTADDLLYTGQWLRGSAEGAPTPSVSVLGPTRETPTVPLPSASTLPRSLATPNATPPSSPADRVSIEPSSSSPAVSAGVGAAADLPMIPAPRTSPEGTTGHSATGDTGPTASGHTATGLPRRPAEDRPSEVDTPPRPPTVPDPDAVRARLASLASGLAAAAQDLSGPTNPLNEARTPT
jgi:signal transduction histidine kinase